MSDDVGIGELLEQEGYGVDPARARAELEERKLTRAGKQRLSNEKLERARTALRERFCLHCAQPGCATHARQSGREPFLTANRSRCESCGGSDNRKAELELIEACRAAGVRKLVIVGGSPSVREELETLVGTQLELRTVDGTARRTGDRALADVLWADLILVWGGSELDHKVSQLYTTNLPAGAKRKVVHVARRGIAALLGEAVVHLRSRASRS